MNLCNRPIYQKSEKVSKDPGHLARVASLPCVICWEWGMAQLSPTQVHHTIHGRFQTIKTPDSKAIPLCEGHHQGNFDTSKIALHRQPFLWREEYGDDVDWINWVEARLAA